MVFKIGKRTWAIPVIDREHELFESLWHIEGANYNSYVVIGDERIAIIDTVMKGFCEEFVERLREIVDPRDVDYIVVNHMEPDHSGCLDYLRRVATNSKVVISNVGKQIFKIGDIGVKEGDILPLGGINLHFHMIPWVHWPETMMTYAKEEGILFTCDLYGAFGAYENIFDGGEKYRENMVRYLVSVLLHYKEYLIRAHERVKRLNPDIIAPGHGIVLREGKERVFRWYDEWLKGGGEGVSIVYGCMYGKIGSAMMKLARELRKRGIRVFIHNVVTTPPSHILSSILQSKVVIIAYPTYEADIFPPLKFFLEIAKEKRVLEGKRYLIVETHGWGPTTEKMMRFLGGGRAFSFGEGEEIDTEKLIREVVHLLNDDTGTG